MNCLIHYLGQISDKQMDSQINETLDRWTDNFVE